MAGREIRVCGVRWLGTHWDALVWVARRGLGERVEVCS